MDGVDPTELMLLTPYRALAWHRCSLVGVAWRRCSLVNVHWLVLRGVGAQWMVFTPQSLCC